MADLTGFIDFFKDRHEYDRSTEKRSYKVKSSMKTQANKHNKCKILLFKVTRVCILCIIVMAILGLSGCFERLAYYPFGTPSPPPEGAEEVQFRTDDGLNLQCLVFDDCLIWLFCFSGWHD